MHLKILPDEGFDIIVACALISISLNSLLFKACGKLERFFNTHLIQEGSQQTLPESTDRTAIVIGFGPVGQAVTSTLEEMGLVPVIIENDVDTVAKLKTQNRTAIFGDASLEHIQEVVHIETAGLLIITIPDVVSAMNSIKVARQHNPGIKIIARANYVSDQELLKGIDVEVICSEEETKQAFIQIMEKYS